MDHISKSLDRIMDSAAPGRTRPLICFEQLDAPRSVSVPAAVGVVIGELGLRYRPSAQADLEAHAEALRLLSEDVADIPPDYLDAAARRWVRENKFMPRASELIDLAKSIAAGVMAADTRTLAQRYNDRDANDPKARLDRMWIDLPEGGVKLILCEPQRATA